MYRGAWRATVDGVTKELDTTEQLNNNNYRELLNDADIPALQPVTSESCTLWEGGHVLHGMSSRGSGWGAERLEPPHSHFFL